MSPLLLVIARNGIMSLVEKLIAVSKEFTYLRKELKAKAFRINNLWPMSRYLLGTGLQPLI
jgi:hypothetical protein